MKYWIMCISSVLLAALLAGGGTYYLANKKYQSEKLARQKAENRLSHMWPPQPQFEYWSLDNQAATYESTIANWLTYTSNDGKFSLRYPLAWEVTEFDNILSVRPKGKTNPEGPIDLGSIVINGNVSLGGKSFDDQFSDLDYSNGPDSMNTFITAEDTTLSGGAKARYFTSTEPPVPTHNYYIDAADVMICASKVIAEYSNLSKTEDNEAIGIINSIKILK